MVALFRWLRAEERTQDSTPAAEGGSGAPLAEERRMEGHERSEATQGFPFRFTNSLEIDAKTGVIYFTDSSELFQRW
ncbi:hypothetical protein B296_00044303 [Ensete ventricosum]|uniref:Strictosidine synthase conserved region domain-containing protein n=1 Tax=Ensete ventricosum TaxID=4639 RepID=A0A426YT85_ENSVE|nr:hypothetical protein B296_00044303 [Ensete ventricosum]